MERKDLSISKNDAEILSIEITNKTKNIILSSVFRPPDSRLNKFKNYLKPIFDKYIHSGLKLDNNKYNQKLPHIYVLTKWMENNYFLS